METANVNSREEPNGHVGGTSVWMGPGLLSCQFESLNVPGSQNGSGSEISGGTGRLSRRSLIADVSVTTTAVKIAIETRTLIRLDSFD